MKPNEDDGMGAAALNPEAETGERQESTDFIREAVGDERASIVMAVLKHHFTPNGA